MLQLQHDLLLYRRLSASSQRLFISFVAFSIVDPLIGLFSSAFLWKNLQSIHGLLLYQGALYGGILLGFIINRKLLKYFSLVKLYAVFLAVRGLPFIMLFYLSPLTREILILLGLLSGVTGGIYWGSRILLAYELTRPEERSYFTSLEIATQLVLSVLVPLSIGWFLDTQGTTSSVDNRYLYQYVGLFGGACLLLGSIGAVSIHATIVLPEQHDAAEASSSIKKLYVVYFLSFLFQSSLLVYPPLLILEYLGQEFQLGSIQSIASLFTALSVYFYGSRGSSAWKIPKLALGVVAVLLGVIALGTLPTYVGIALYVILSGLGAAFMNAVVNPLYFDCIAQQVTLPGQSYRYIINREAMMNCGRAIMLVATCGLAVFCPHRVLLYVGPALCGMAVLPILPLVRSAARGIK